MSDSEPALEPPLDPPLDPTARPGPRPERGEQPEPGPRPEPGERPPDPGRGLPHRLDRAPSDRYRGRATTDPATTGRSESPLINEQRRVVRRAVIGACVAGTIGAGLLTVILAVLASTAGTFAVSAVASAAIGLIVASGTLPLRGAPARPGSPGLDTAPLSRDQATGLAVGIALGMIVLAGLLVWLVARLEGGVMDPLTYLWTTFGFGLPAQAVVALVGSAWGAANGPIRWRS